MTAWWALLAPVKLPVACGEENHALHWAEGTLAAPEHPDADRERALAALGADPSPCLQILDAWNRRADDLDVLVLAGRGPSDPLDDSRLQFAGRGPGHFGFGGYAPLAHATAAFASTLSVRPAAVGWTAFSPMGRRRYVDFEDEAPVDEVSRLLSLGAGLPQRLTATVIGTWAERIDAGDERVARAAPALDAAVYGRLRATLLPWLGSPVSIRFTMQPPGAQPALRREGDVVHAELPFAWLRDVWMNGLAVILDRFSLRAAPESPGTWMLSTVNRDLSGPQDLMISD